MNRNTHIKFENIVVIALALGVGYGLFISDPADVKVVVRALLIGCFYIFLHIKLVGHNSVFFVLSFSVAWLFLCQSPLYIHYYDILSKGRWFAIGATLVVSLVAGIYAKRKVRLTWFIIFPLLMGAYFYLTMLWSVNPELTVGRSISVMLMSSTVMGFVWYTGNSVANLHKTIKAIALPVAFLFWILTPIYGFDTSLLERGLLRSAGPMLNPNGIGVLGAFLAPVTYYLWRKTSPKSNLLFGLFLTCVVMVIFSGTRSALSATLLAFTLILIQRMYSFSLGALLIGVASLVISVGLLSMEVYGIPEMFQSYLRIETLQTASGRFEAWDIGLDLLRKRPWVGYGFGTEDVLFEKFGIRFLTHGGAMVHNSYLGLSLQIGILGAAIFFIPMFLVVIKGVQGWLRSKNAEVSILTATVIAGLVISFTESWLYSAGNSQSLPFWILFGILVQLLTTPGQATSDPFHRKFDQQSCFNSGTHYLSNSRKLF